MAVTFKFDLSSVTIANLKPDLIRIIYFNQISLLNIPRFISSPTICYFIKNYFQYVLESGNMSDSALQEKPSLQLKGRLTPSLLAQTNKKQETGSKVLFVQLFKHSKKLCRPP